MALDLDLQVAVAAAAAAGDQQAVVDAPADDAAAAVHLVLGRAEGQQAELREEQDHGALGLAVLNVHEAKREAAQGAPVGAGDAFEVFGVPEALQLGGREVDVGALARGDRAGPGVERSFVDGGVEDGAGDHGRVGAAPPGAGGGHRAMLATATARAGIPAGRFPLA